MKNVILGKLNTEYSSPVEYALKHASETVNVNALIGKDIEIRNKDKIICNWCGKTTRKSFAQGYCYNCFVSCPETEPCVLRPELCRVQWGDARDLKWATEKHLKPHYVYLSFTSNFKVGITRKTQIPTRWIDQGAIAAIALLETPNRHVAGVIEDYMKQYFSDRTRWNDMLRMPQSDVDFTKSIALFMDNLPVEFNQYIIDNPRQLTISYPYEGDMDFKAVNLDKDKSVKGTLVGIKGQYLLFKNGAAINIRKYSGYVVDIIV